MGCAPSAPAINQVPKVRRMGVPNDETASALTPQSSVYSRDTSNGGREGWVARTFSNARSSKDEVLPRKEIKVGGLGYSQFILDKGEIRINDVYSIDRKKLGQGTFGYVSRAKNKATKEVRAVKTIAKDAKEPRPGVSPRGNQDRKKRVERIKLEIAIMKLLDHPNICKLYEYFEDHKNVYLVMELCNGGELLSRIVNSLRFSESEAAALMQQIFRAVLYMHSNLVCHRDIKPENLLFLSGKEPVESSLLKIVDFGQSCMFKPGSEMTSKAGTPYYVAPQVLQGKYDETSDLWSCGVIMYLMLVGYPPFFGDSDSEVLAKVKAGKFEFKHVDWRKISSGAKTLVNGLLQMDPRMRCTAKQALSDPWLDRHAPQAEAEDLKVDSKWLGNLRSFRSKNKLEKAALHIIATQLKEPEIRKLREVFTFMDKDCDGLLSIFEFREGLLSCRTSVIEDLQEIFEEMDMDGSGYVNYTEWLSASLSQQVYHQEEVLWAAFKHFDRDGDGRISVGDLHNVLESGDVQDTFSVERIHEVMQAVHGEAAGHIDFREFLSFIRHESMRDSGTPDVAENNEGTEDGISGKNHGTVAI